MTGFYKEYDDTSGAYVSSAEDAAAAALVSKNAAAASATAAAASELSAGDQATAASLSQTNAGTSATNAATSATNAATSETNAAGSATAAAGSATSASTDAGTATTKASEASTSATNAATSETNAASSATNAATSETNAATSATNAASSATTASTQATNAASSATAAATSETNAGNSATAAATSETNAASSATSASGSATTATTKAGEAATSATNAATSETNAATSATNSANSATSAGTAQTAAEAARDAALAAFDSFDDRYLGPKASDPTTDNDGDALAAGMLYFNTTTDDMKVYEGSSWVAAYASLSGALLATNNLSDLNNVATARTNLGLGTAATTASTDYATSAQGTTADNALPKSGGAMTGAITTNSTFDGRDVATDGTKLDGIEANADVTDTANVTAAGALMDSELTSIASVKALNQGVATTDSPTFAAINVNGLVTSDDFQIDLGTNTASVQITSPSNIASVQQLSIKNTHTEGYLSFGTVLGQSTIKSLGAFGTADPLNIHVGSTTAIGIDAQGLVGIGTTSPSAPLHVQKGSAGFSAFPSGNWAAKIFNQTDAPTEHGLVVANRWAAAASTAFEVGGLFDDGNGFDTFLKVNGSGQVGIGTSSPDEALEVNGDAKVSGADSGNAGVLHFGGVSDDVKIAGFDRNSGTANSMLFYTNTAERMRIDSSGNVMVGTTTAPVTLATSTNSSDTGMSTNNNGRVTFASNNTYIMTLNRYNSNGNLIRFAKDGVVTGSISTNGSSLPSDRNFKKNISDLALGLDFVNSLSPKTYNFKIDDEGQPVMAGLIAQEVEAALTAAGVERNSMTLLQHEPTENVNDSDYQMDYVKFVPILINSIKEQQTLIDSLTARIAALEA